MSPKNTNMEEDIRKRMRELNVVAGDVDESFIRASGPGGQNVNKVATCVRLHHRPTGIVVKCQAQRSQVQNRYGAWKLLLSKIKQRRTDAIRKEVQKKEKLRRQKRKRSRKAKERMLANKKYRSEIKIGRKKTHPHEI